MTELPNIEFSRELVRRVGDIAAVLEEFLEKQSSGIQRALHREIPEAPPNAVRKVLNFFVTLEGTKRPYYKKDINIPKLQPDVVHFCLGQLEKARILRIDDNQYELAHDTLADVIARKRSQEEVALLEVKKVVQDRMREFGGKQTYLNRNELLYIANFEKQLQDELLLEAEAWEFIEKSKKRTRNRRRNTRIVIAAVFLFLAASTLISIRQGKIAEHQKELALEQEQIALSNADSFRLAEEKAQTALQQLIEKEQKLREQRLETARATYESYLNRGNAAENQGDYLKAVESYNRAVGLAASHGDSFDNGGQRAQQAIRRSLEKNSLKERFDNLANQGDRLLEQGVEYYRPALQKYRQAFALNFNPALAQAAQVKIDQTLLAIDNAFSQYKDRGLLHLKRNDPESACHNLKIARYLVPDDEEVRILIEEHCK